ncbi:MAG: hypothetical protein OEV55_01455 [candidate division Zixibacteria bacterium]|nr:hypothetical protein [candidate division Zixibacteria bacterium]
MKKTYVLIIVVMVISFLALNANAFDGKRKGFILGGGIGPGVTLLKSTVSYSSWFDEHEYSESSDWESKFGLITNFKIGYAPSDHVEIYFTVKDSWYGSTIYWGGLESEDVVMASGFWGPGVTYYFKPEAPSYFITGGFGLSTLSLPFESDAEIKFGGGVFAGAGYEFARHYSVELDLMWGKVSNFALFGIDEDTSVLTVALTFNALAF